MECPQAIERIKQSFDEGTDHTPELDPHLAECPSCQSKAKELTSMESLLHTLPVNAPEGIENRVIAAVAQERARRNRPAVIGTLAACALIGTTALNYAFPARQIEEKLWNYTQRWIPDTEWLGSGRSYQDQLEQAWSNTLNILDKVDWLSTSLIWSALAASIVLLTVLNGICAAQLRQSE